MFSFLKTGDIIVLLRRGLDSHISEGTNWLFAVTLVKPTFFTLCLPVRTFIILFSTSLSCNKKNYMSFLLYGSVNLIKISLLCFPAVIIWFC